MGEWPNEGKLSALNIRRALDAGWDADSVHTLLADLSRSYSDGSARVTVVQDLVLRWVPTTALEELYKRLAAAGLLVDLERGFDGVAGEVVDVETLNDAVLAVFAHARERRDESFRNSVAAVRWNCH